MKQELEGHRLSRRKALATAAALAGASALPPLGRAARAQEADTPASLRRAGGKLIRVRIWNANQLRDIRGLNRYLDQNPGLSVEWIQTPFARYRDRMVTEFVGNEPLDLVQVPETELAAWADSTWLAPLDDRPELAGLLADALPVAREGVRGPDGKAYALPFQAEAFGFLYNKALLDKAGFAAPARTLDELRSQMQAVRQQGLSEFPLSIGLKRAPGQFWSLWATLYASGGALFDSEHNPVFDGQDPSLRAILEWYSAAIHEWKIVSLADLQLDWGGSRIALRSGNTGFTYGAQFSLSELNLSAESAVKGQIRMALVPGLDRNDAASVGYSHGLGIAATSPDKDAVWPMLRYLASKDDAGRYTMPRERFFAEGGRCPYRPVFDDPQVAELIQTINLGDATDYTRLSAIVRQRQAIKAAWYPEWEYFFMSQVQDCLTRKIGIGEALVASAREARRLRRG